MNFPDTRWTLIAKLTSPGQTEEALGSLCRGYWQSVYAFLRREGRTHEDAQDIAQGFFMVVLRNDLFQRADRNTGRLRSFLVAALKHHLQNQRRVDTAGKRNGGLAPVPLGAPEVMAQVERLACQCATPAEAFDRAWLWTLLGRVLDGLGEEYRAAGKQAVFEAALPWVMGDADAPQADPARSAGLSVSHFRVQIHRLRMRYRDALRREIAATVTEDGEADSELEYLFSLSAGSV